MMVSAEELVFQGILLFYRYTKKNTKVVDENVSQGCPMNRKPESNKVRKPRNLSIA